MSRTVLFVCLHGAGKSRIAAALFNSVAQEGWQAITAGTEPQAAASTNPARLLAGTPAEPFVDQSIPRSIESLELEPARIIAIDCSIPGAEQWQLDHQQFDEGMRDELKDRVTILAEGLAF